MTFDELKVTVQTVWDELPQEHINKAVTNLTKHLTTYVVVTLSICDEPHQTPDYLRGGHSEHLQQLSIFKTASSSHHQQTRSCHSCQQVTGEDSAWNAAGLIAFRDSTHQCASSIILSANTTLCSHFITTVVHD